MTNFSYRILCVDNDRQACEIIRLKLKETGKNYSLTSISNPHRALRLIEKQPFDLYIIDYLLPDMSGIELCRRIRQSDAETPIIFFGRPIDEKDIKSALKTGANEYLRKPDGLEILEEKISRLLVEKRILDKRKIMSGFADEKVTRCFSFIETF